MKKSLLALATMLLTGSFGVASSADASELGARRSERTTLRAQETSTPVVVSDERLTARRTLGDGALADARDEALTVIRPGGLALKAQDVLSDPLAAFKADLGVRRGLAFQPVTYSDDTNRGVVPADTGLTLIDGLNQKRRAVRNGLAFEPVLLGPDAR